MYIFRVKSQNVHIHLCMYSLLHKIHIEIKILQNTLTPSHCIPNKSLAKQSKLPCLFMFYFFAELWDESVIPIICKLSVNIGK